MFTNRVFRLFSVASTNLTRIQITYQTIFHKRSLRNIFDSSSAQFTTITNANDTNLGRIQFNQTANGNVGIRFYCDTHRKEIKFKMTKGKELIKDAIETKRINLREKKEVFVKDLREKRSRVQEKVKEMEEIVERENILTIPNLLCVGRGILAPIVGYIIVQEQYVLAIGLLAVAGLTDLADGYIARNWPSQASKLGSFLDPMADKVLVGALVISLSYCSLFPVWLSAMVIFRDVFLITAGFVIRYISLPPPRTITRYFDATHVTAKLKPTFISKVNTGVQLFAIGSSLGAPIWGYVDHSTLHGLWYLTGVTTLAAALSYVLQKDTYRIIKESGQRKKKT